MCDQTEVSYLEDDVVWVKIGPIWWPGVVKDLEKDEEGREILTSLKKKPIAAVKFFQEDNYEFVKNLDHIYHYNCRRKDEFIKKGLDKFRSGAVHMKKFPADVTTAESLVHGDVNIVNDPKFYPEKKQNYNEIFGTGKKKNKKESEVCPKQKSRSSNCNTPYRPITHQRFINKVLHGESDHRVKTLIQPSSSPDDMSRGIYRCHLCKFETVRVNVIVAHHRLTHSPKNSINWTGSDVKAIRKKPMYKSRKNKPKRHVESPKIESSDEEYIDPKTSKTTNEGFKSHVKTKTSMMEVGSSVSFRKRILSEVVSDDIQKRPRFTDVLLADWSEEDEEEKKVVESENINDDCLSSKQTEEDVTLDTARDSRNYVISDREKGEVKNQHEKMSCFDFEEEEDGLIGMNNANTYGRKIPRVIPLKDKPELDVDLEIGELLKRKHDTGNEDWNTTTDINKEKHANELKARVKSDEEEKGDNKTKNESDKEREQDDKLENPLKCKRRTSKSKEVVVNEQSIAVRRPRRLGAKKSYLNEIIEKIDDKVSSEMTEEKTCEIHPEVQNINIRKAGKEESFSSSSSRRKQDLRGQSMENRLEETVYSEIVNNEPKMLNIAVEKKSVDIITAKSIEKDDLTKKIDNLLAETSITNFPQIPDAVQSKIESVISKPKMSASSSAVNISFDYVPSECSDEASKNKADVNTINLCPDLYSELEEKQEKHFHSEDVTVGLSEVTHDEKQRMDSKIATPSPNLVAEDIKVGISEDSENSFKVSSSEASGDSSSNCHSNKEGKVVLEEESSCSLEINTKESKTLIGNSEEMPEKKISDNPESANEDEVKTTKSGKVKTDSLSSTLISTSGKLKGQTIIHQKGGTYVILSQQPQIPRHKITAAKGQTPGKLVILTNQLGEQKIITTSGLQQNKFKLDPQKVIVASSATNISADATASTSGILTVGKPQPVIKMVPDGKGGVMKQLTVSPKKVLVGGTKVLVSAAGTSFSTQGNSIQKIALTCGNTLGSDYRVIENYKGSGKTVLIQGNSTPTGVILKTSPGVQRSTGSEGAQGSQNILNVKKKPKILMRSSANQNEYIVHSDITGADTPTYIMKRKGADGKFSAQKLIRRPVLSSPKGKNSSNGGARTFFLSEQSLQKTESLLIQTNQDHTTNKIIRVTQKVKESEIKQKLPQKVIHKNREIFSVPENSMLTATDSDEGKPENKTTQLMQMVQGHSQEHILQTQVMAMPGPVGSDGNQTYLLVSVDEHGVVQPVDNSLLSYPSGQTEPVFMDTGSNNNVIVINTQTNEELKPVFSNGSQDILAEALANTNVLEGNMSTEIDSVVPSILLPPSIPSSVVQETSVTLQKPIMTPLEMPSSVAPDTSGLEPPPLPPTPTEEDVLMEDQDTELHDRNALVDQGPINVENTKSNTSDNKPENLLEVKTSEGGRATSGDDFVLESPQEDQGTSFQSMPLLNDEPDTSDTKGSEPVADQESDLQKASKTPNQDLPLLLREQEPPSSTNNEVISETDSEHRKTQLSSKLETHHLASHDDTPGDNGSKINEVGKNQENPKLKDMVENKETQSMPIIMDDGNLNSYAFGPVYMGALAHNRFQEETEVTSTTDEFSNKDNNA